MSGLFLLVAAGLLQPSHGQCKDVCCKGEYKNRHLTYDCGDSAQEEQKTFECGECVGKTCSAFVGLVTPGCTTMGIDAQKCVDLGHNLEALCQQATQVSGSCTYSYSVKCYLACDGQEDCVQACNQKVQTLRLPANLSHPFSLER
mmetsp:Transcript_58264/g.104295  ORF Transcript_58264/g.104295 Transcript_58264/m.104295 type:complete len:145 (+) Transcript_58264:69-503(+)